MEVARVLWDIAIILLSTKAMGMLMRRLGLPQVVGMVLAGLLVGPAIWGRFGWAPIMPNEAEKTFLGGIAEIGVVMILFSAGLETDLGELKRTGLVATLIAFAGVIVPMALGFLIAVPFLGGFSALRGDRLITALFVGVILTATSVGITVETLKEMGKLRGRMGQTLLSAAIIDDVIGITVLSVVLGLRDSSQSVTRTILMTVLFFVLAIAVGVALRFLFKWLAKKYDHHRRIPIFALVVCFLFAYAAEAVFGIADITGAYVAGILLSGSRDTKYIDRKVDVNSYMIFSPVFFANIGIGADFTGFNGTVLGFAAAFVAVGILGKIVGCMSVAKAARFNWRDASRIGFGMVARGEVALVVCNKGIAAGVFAGTALEPILIAVILLVVCSSLVAPIGLKLLSRGEPSDPCSGADGTGGGGDPTPAASAAGAAGAEAAGEPFGGTSSGAAEENTSDGTSSGGTSSGGNA